MAKLNNRIPSMYQLYRVYEHSRIKTKSRKSQKFTVEDERDRTERRHQGFKKRNVTGIAAVTNRYPQPPWPFLDLFTLRTKITAKSPLPLRPRNRLENAVIWTGKKESNLILKKKHKNRRRRNLNLIFCTEKSGISNLNLINYLLLFFGGGNW